MLISCMKNHTKGEINTANSSIDEDTQKITSPQKKSLSFASSSPPQTNNSSFSKNSFEEGSNFQEGIFTTIDTFIPF